MSLHTKTSKFLSLVLRHKPEVVGLKLDKEGYVKVDELIIAFNNSNKELNLEILKEIVSSDSKGRYSFSNGYDKIRANQGHSIKVDLGLPKATPQGPLYHGTVSKFSDSIAKNGLLKGAREHVHLSDSINTAIEVGKRRGKPIVYEVDALAMINDGYSFYLSKNNVWLTESVPAQYLTLRP